MIAADDNAGMTESSAIAAPAIVIAGPTASGKSTVGAAVAAALGVPFIDGDDLHPESNKAKMGSGVPLTDEDRWPWLAVVGQTLRDHSQADGVVVACSALTRRYRDAIRETAPMTWFGVLHADEDELVRRSQSRTDHFMPPALVRSQIELLEPLEAGERGAMLDTADHTPHDLVGQILAEVGHTRP